MTGDYQNIACYFCYCMYDLIIFIAHLMTFIQMGLGLGLGAKNTGHEGSGETRDSREEEDTQWTQVIT